jgi:hypothetical protein
VARISPIDASARILAHLREAWDHAHPEHPLARQDVVLTLPASFDEVARELTIRAARQAGLPKVVLIEEPQAAFYAWIHAQRGAWEDQVLAGQKILVCDIGGGTTDLTLIRVRAGDDGRIRFHRVAVGEHLLLGGDNLDLLLAQHLEARLAAGGRLPPREWGILVRTSRNVKETFLGDDPPAGMRVVLPARGARLVGDSLSAAVTRDEVVQLFLEGFLPRVPLSAAPQSRASGFQEFGLPFAPDAAVTRYLAAFLRAHRHVDLVAGHREAATDPRGGDPARPDLVLFNGGFFAAAAFRQRICDLVSEWFTPEQAPAWQPRVLKNERLDLAVAQGAAYYGMVRRGCGVRIAAGLARTYYVGAASRGDAAGHDAKPSAVRGEGDATAAAAHERAPAQPPPRCAICLLPAGTQEGQTVDLEGRRFALRIQQPVEFPLYVSSTRLVDAAGAVVAVDPEQMTALPPVRTVLQVKRNEPAATVAVELHARLTEIGTMELWCTEIGGHRSWRLDFDVRSATQTDRAGHAGGGEATGMVELDIHRRCRKILQQTFGGDKPAADAAPESIVKRLEEASNLRRRDWPGTLLRGYWETLLSLEAGRRASERHEARWLFLVGFSLRPGFGIAVDDWRVSQTWRLLQGKRIHHTPGCRVEWLILWRRIAGGLAAGQQQALAEPLLAAVVPAPGGARKSKGASPLALAGHELAELWRLLASLELLEVRDKVRLGDALAARLAREKVGGVHEACLWSLGRLGARAPMYGPLNTVVPHESALAWARAIMDADRGSDAALFPVVQLVRRTGDRYRDIPDADRSVIGRWLAQRGANMHYLSLVEEGGALEAADQGLALGDSLPPGLEIA